MTDDGMAGARAAADGTGDWFSALVTEAGAGVLRRADIGRSLARTSRVSQESLEEDILRSAGVDR